MDSIAILNQNFFDKSISKYVTDNHIACAVAGLVQDGKLVHVYSKDTEKYSVQPSKLQFRIASMTKCFASCLILKLRDENKLKLEDSVTKYIPELNSKVWDTVTIYKLLTMQTGLLTDNPWADRLLDMTDSDFSDLLKTDFFFTDNADSFSYSNLSYMLLGRVISNIRGISALKVISDELIVPLEMSSTEWNPSKVFVEGQKFVDNKYITEKFFNVQSDSAVFGGLWSNLEDLSIWTDFMQDASKYENILSAKSRAELQTCRIKMPQISVELNNRLFYCYGVIESEYEDTKLIGHSGGLPGYGSHFRWTSADEIKVGIIFLSNNTYSTSSDVCRQVLSKSIKNIKELKKAVPHIIDKRAKDLIEYLSDTNLFPAETIFASNFFGDNPKAEFESRIEKLKNTHKISTEKEILILMDNDFGFRVVLGDEELCYVSLSPAENAKIQEVVWLS